MNAERFVICIDNTGFPVSLELRKLYQVVPDAQAEGRGMIRLIDESGEDYLYPAGLFLDPELTETTRRILSFIKSDGAS